MQEIPATSGVRLNAALNSVRHESVAGVGQHFEGPMNYQAFTNDALLMMHFSTRGALAVDDELTRLSAECRFRVRENSDWKKHADDLEAEMSKREMNFEAIDWLQIQTVDGVPDSAALQPEPPQPDRGSAPRDPVSREADDGNARLKRRIAAFIRMS
ncbi:MAG: hypothetical protein ABI196_21190 [Bradyrhizobium sp.]